MAIRVGDIGRAVSSLSPSGSVELGGVLEKGHSNGEVIDAGSAIVVLGGDATGYVVSKVEPGQSPPRRPNHGAPARGCPVDESVIDAADAWSQERRKQRRKLWTDLKYDGAAVASLGGLVGLLSAVVGLWLKSSTAAEHAEPWGLLLGLAAAGAAWGVALMLITAWFGMLLALWQGDSKLANSSALPLISGLLGAAIGFWLQFGAGNAGVITAWTIGFSLVAWMLGSGIKLILDQI